MYRPKYGNKKVIVDGVKFDSQLEMYCYDMFNKFKIPFKFQVEYELQPAFRDSAGKAVRRIYMKIDFVFTHQGKTMIVDTMGHATELSKVKYKMLNYQLNKINASYEIVWLKNKKKVNDFILNIHHERLQASRTKPHNDLP